MDILYFINWFHALLIYNQEITYFIGYYKSRCYQLIEELASDFYMIYRETYWKNLGIVGECRQWDRYKQFLLPCHHTMDDNKIDKKWQHEDEDDNDDEAYVPESLSGVLEEVENKLQLQTSVRFGWCHVFSLYFLFSSSWCSCREGQADSKATNVSMQ